MDNNFFRNVCLWCKRLLYAFRRKQSRQLKGMLNRPYFSPNKKRAVQKIQKSKAVIKKKYSRANLKIMKLQNILNVVKKKMNDITDETLDELLQRSGIAKGQSELIKEIFSAAKYTNVKNRRYSDNWILLCLLFQMR